MAYAPRLILIFSVSLLALSLSSIFARMVPDIPAVTISFWRMGVASIVLWVYSIFRRQSVLRQKDKTKTRIAGLFLAFHFICFFGALKHTSVSNTTILAATAPFFAAIIEHWWLKRSWRRGVLIGLALAFFGILVIQGGELTLLSRGRIGNGLALMSAIWIALVMILSEDIRKKNTLIIYTRYLYTTTAMVLLALTVSMDLPLVPESPEAYIWLFLLGLVPTLLGHSLLYYAIKFVRPTIVSTIPLGEPILASFFAFVLFQEVVSGFVLLGGIITLCGLYIVITRH